MINLSTKAGKRDKAEVDIEHFSSVHYDIAVPIQMRYNIISRGVGARQCRAPTGVPHTNEKRYNCA